LVGDECCFASKHNRELIIAIYEINVIYVVYIVLNSDVTIEETTVRIQESFDQLVQMPRNASVNKRVSNVLHQQVNLLSRTMRPRMLRALDKLSPKYQIIEKPLLDVSSFRQHAAKPMPDSLRNALQHMWGYVSANAPMFINDLESWPLTKLIDELQRRTLEKESAYLLASTALSELKAWIPKS
jgi:hypothetical protein